jgi:hypothetical protein
MPVVAPEFSVGDRPQADRFLPRDRTADRFVFDRLRFGSLALRALTSSGGRSRLPTWSA